MSGRQPIPIIPFPSSPEIKRGIGVSRNPFLNIAVFMVGNTFVQAALAETGHDQSFSFTYDHERRAANINQPYLHDGQLVSFQTTVDDPTRLLTVREVPESSLFDKNHNLIANSSLEERVKKLSDEIKPGDGVRIEAEVYGTRRPVAVSLSDPEVITWQNTESPDNVKTLFDERINLTSRLTGIMSVPSSTQSNGVGTLVNIGPPINRINPHHDTNDQPANFQTYQAMYDIARAHGADSIGELYARDPQHFAELMKGVERGREVDVRIFVEPDSVGQTSTYTEPDINHAFVSCFVPTAHYQTETAPLPHDLTLPILLPFLAYRVYRRQRRLKDPATKKETGAIVPSAKQRKDVASGSASLDDQLIVERYERSLDRLRAIEQSHQPSPRALTREFEQLRQINRKNKKRTLIMAAVGIGAPFLGLLGYKIFEQKPDATTVDRPSATAPAPQDVLDQLKLNPVCAATDEVFETAPPGK